MTWTDFMRQYDAAGREKGDGYSPADFAGMSERQRARARAMMLRRALDGDTIDLSGLRHIGDAETAATLAADRDMAGRRGWRSDVVRREVLYELTADLGCLTGLAVHLDGRDPEAQQAAAYALTWYVLPPAAELFLVERIADGRHEAALLPLLKAWIALKRQAVCDQPCFDRHLPMIRAVSAARPSQRPGLLAI